MSLVSVVMSVYNAEPYLNEAITSILKQSYRDFEFIIVNDGSTDLSAEIIQRHAARDRRIKLYHMKSNEGAYVSLNYGLHKATGQLIMRQDADDISDINRLKMQLNHLKTHRDIACLGTYIKCISEDPKDYASGLVAQQERWNNTFTTAEEIFSTRFMRCPMLHGTAIFRKEDCEKVGYYDEQYYTGADFDFLLKMTFLGKVAKLPKKLYTYRIVKKSLYHSNMNTNFINTIKIRLRWIQYYFNKQSRSINNVSFVCEKEHFDAIMEAASQCDVNVSCFISSYADNDYKGIKVCNINALHSAPPSDIILIKHKNVYDIMNRLRALNLIEMTDFINITA